VGEAGNRKCSVHGSSFQAAQFGLEVQSVIALRLMRLAAGGNPGRREARLMFAEKMAALTEAQIATAATILTGRSHTAAKKVVQVYKKRVRANKTRLSRRR
jgi:hypothetical protein